MTKNQKKALTNTFIKLLFSVIFLSYFVSMIVLTNIFNSPYPIIIGIFVPISSILLYTAYQVELDCLNDLDRHNKKDKKIE